MNKYQLETILVPTDFSEMADKALSQAIKLAIRSHSKLVVIHVVELTGYTMPAEMMSLGLITEQVIDDAKEKLKNLIAKIRNENNIKVEHANYLGSVYENIVRASHLFNADMIIMGTHGASGFKEWLFGTNAFSVVKNSTIPVLTVHRNTADTGFKRIVFPFNFNHLTLNKLEHVMALAIPFESTVLLLGFADQKTKLDNAALTDLGYNLSLKFAKAGVKCEYSILEGENHSEMILNHAMNNKADLISIVTMKDSKNETFLPVLGKEVVNHSKIPVLCVPAPTLTQSGN